MGGTSANPLKPAAGPRFPLLDPIRGLAALTIVGYHLALSRHDEGSSVSGRAVTQLDAGVAIFFVLSGFLMYRQFLAARVEGERMNVWGYAANRVLRIVPAYWFCLLALQAVRDVHVTGSNWWRYWFFLQTIDKRTALTGDLVAWTLGAELSFYVLLPFIAAGIGALSSKLPGETWAEIAIISVLGAAGLVVIAITGNDSVLQFTLFGTIEWFAAGMLLATVSVRRPGWARKVVDRAPHPWVVAMLLFVVMMFVLPPFVTPLTGHETNLDLMSQHLLYAGFGVLVVLPGAQGRALPKVFFAPLLAWLGLVSYGIYLWHAPLLDSVWIHAVRLPGGWLTATAAAFGTAIACGAGSYYLVERMALRYRQPTRLRAASPEPEPASASLVR